MKKREMFIKLLAVLVASFVAVISLTQSFTISKVKAAVILQNPRVVPDFSMEAGQKVTYDCIWFGSYPQTEIVDQGSTSGVYGKLWAQNTDYEENNSLYTALKNATGWDSNGDITLSGTKYHRIKLEDITFSEFSDHYYASDASGSYYNWSSSDTYHYFRYDPIKWRVLNVDSSGTQALLSADKVLDNQLFSDITNTKTTWKNSTLRSWLNGYDSSTNSYGTDYTNQNFINSAFSSSERSAILFTYLNNRTTGPYSENYGGEDTNDKVFLLSSYDMYNSDASASYGFYKADSNKYDEARRRKSSTYAKAMGVWSYSSAKYHGNCFWWLRSPGETGGAAAVWTDGYINTSGHSAAQFGWGVCPALNLNPSSSNLYSYAGTVCSDGIIKEIKPGSEPIISENIKKTQTITASNKTIAINNKTTNLGAKTSGNGKLSYSSSTPSVANISASGIITPKNYGVTTITIKATETSVYKAAKKVITVAVVPKKMTFVKVKSPAKKTILLKWKKDKDATKYEIQLCMKKNFKKNTISRTCGKKVVKQKIINMKRKTWYVRIRAWKRVNGRIFKGIWSTVKEIKIK